MADEHDDTGYDAAPTRYTAHGRETIDRMRDFCYSTAVQQRRSSPSLPEKYIQGQADLLFATHCTLAAMKYRDRIGRKEGVDPARDARAAQWYTQMARHVLNPDDEPDPRAGRPDFQPYRRQPQAPEETS